MTWNKRSSGIIEADCDRCGNGLIGTLEFLEDEEWMVLRNEEKSVYYNDCMGELEDEGMDCPECSSAMDVYKFIHMSKTGPKGVKCFVCECGEKVPLAGSIEVC